MFDSLDVISDLANKLFVSLLSFLPDSPFRDICQFVDKYEILGILNWIIPFDIFSATLDLWLACVSAYYIFLYSKGLLSGKNKLIFQLLEAFFG